MNTKITINRIAGVIILLSFLFIGKTNLSQNPLNGTYTIGTGGTAGYETINKAVDSLVANGVDGPVIMNILAGNYNEQIGINPISGVSAVNTVTFQSQDQDPETVMIYWANSSSNSNWVIGLWGCEYVTLQYLKIYSQGTTYARVIRFDGTTQNNTITNNILIGASGTPTGNAQAVISCADDDISYTEISYNEIMNGAHPIWLDSYSTAPSEEVKIINNTCNTNVGMYFNYQNKIEVAGNVINCNYADGISMNNCANDISIQYNTINASYSYGHSGIYVYQTDGSLAFWGLIANNVITVDGNTGYTNHGIYCELSDYQQIYHNTINVSETKTDGSAFRASNGGNIKLKNNMLVISNGYPVRSNNGSNISEIDYNNYYTNGNYIAYWNSSPVNELSGLQSANSQDANSTFIYPNFVSMPDNYHPTTHLLDNTGEDLTSIVALDFDSLARPATPDIGAYEFTATNTTPYSGALTIQASSGTFTTFSEAVDSLVRLGITGAVTISVEDGTYTEQIMIHPVPGASAVNTITFTSASDTVTAVTLEHSSSASSDNYVVYLHNADYITFSKMTFRNNGVSYARIFRLNGNAHDITIDNNILDGNGVAASSSYMAIISSYLDNTDDLTITNNIFSDGDRGIYLSGASVTDKPSGLVISNNEFTGNRTNIFLKWHTDFEISNNNCQDFTWAGVALDGCYSPYSIYNNKLSSTSTTNYGFSIYYCGGSGDGGLIYNNFIYINSSSGITALQNNNSSYVSYYHNSINVISSSSSAKAFYTNSSSGNIILKNNNLVVDGPGYSLYVDGNTAVTECDYNNYFTSGANIARWNSANYSTVASLSASTGKDANSINFNPAYISDSDLHTDSYWLDNAGTPIAQVTTDIDGEARDGTTPDIGADEYISSTIPLDGEYTIGSEGIYTTINDAVNEMVNNGILDTVIFNILTGTYNENFVIPQIAGAADTAVIIFQSQTGIASDVLITYEPSGTSDNYIVKLDGADYVTFQNLSFNTGNSSYASIIVFSGNSQNNSIIGNSFQGRSTSSNSANDAVIATINSPIIHNTLIENNTISNGSYGIYLVNSNGDYAQNVIVTNNTINSYYTGVRLHYMLAPHLESNYITYNWDGGSGIYFYYCSSAASSGLKIIKNQIYSGNSSSSSGSIYLRYCDANASYPAEIYNNVVRGGHVDKSRHIGFYINESDYMNVFHNTVNISSDATDDFAFYSYRSENLTIKNNNFAVCGSSDQNYAANGYAIYINEGSVIASDYNNFYSSARRVIYWVDSYHYDIESLQVTTGLDQNSISVYPAFLGPDDLHSNSSWIDNEGFYLTQVTEDIEGIARDGVSPSIGAYEFVSTQTPIVGGTYSVGISADFPTIDSLELALMELGISGPVVFNLKTGLYLNTIMFLRDIPGASETNNIVIQSETGDPANVTFTHTQTASSNYMIYLNGTDHISLNNMTFTAGGNGYAHIIRMSGNVQHVNIIGNVLNGPTKNSQDDDMASIFSASNQVADNILIANNTFNNNSYGVCLNGWTTYNVSNIVVQNNYFSGQHRAVYFYYVDGPVVQNNIMEGFSSHAVLMYYSDEDIQITGNKMTTEYDNVRVVYIYYCDGSVANQGLIANNFISADGTGSNAYGINITSSTYQRVYYNSVNITGSNWGGVAGYFWGSSNIAILNNIFAHKLGLAYQIQSAGVASISDYNNLYSEDSHFARINYTDYNNFAAFQIALGHDANSHDLVPDFATDDDLHLYNNELMGLAIPLGDVLLDIDGEVRDASNPDIGADELICSTATLNVPDYTICQYETVELENNSTGYVNGTMFLWDFNNSLPYEDTTYSFDTVFSYAFTSSGIFNTAKLTAVQPGGCQDEITFSVTVNAKPDIPVTTDIVLGCFGHDMPELVAEGTDIRWYNNMDLDISNLVFTGDSLATGQTGMGNYTYYATQTTTGCESDYSESTLSVRTTPDPPVAPSASICLGDTIPTLTATGDLIVWYANAELTEVLFSASEFTPLIDTAGTYTYYVTQNNGECESFATEVELEVLPAPIIAAIVSNIDCEGADFGTINLTITEGDFPYYFAWSNGKIAEDVSNLVVGEYFVIVTDASGCQATDTFNITEPANIVIDLITNDSECAASNGKVTVTASGGNPPFAYHWSNGKDGVINDSLSSGIYIVTVSDASQCTEVAVATINDIGAPVIAVNAVLDVSCYGGSDGQISLTVTGGASPYDFEWSNGEITDDVNGLAAGPYEFQVTDTLGCLALESFVITEPLPINIIMSTFESSCGQATGSAIANVLGGSPPFDYSWSTGSTNPETLSGLILGVYGLTVTDNKSCTASKLFSISEIGAPSVVVDSVIEGSCGESDGAIYISVYGAAGEYTYLWSNDSSTEDLIGVNAGEYSVVVSDTSGCSAAAVATIESDRPPVNPLCMVSVDTGTFYNEIIWEKEYTEGVHHYNIYKESTQSDVYFLTGSVPVNEESIFIDSLSNSLQRSWRYKLSVVDSCGVESELSEEHKTMHLTVNEGVGGNVNLIWDHYEGVDFDTYYIQRYTETDGWVLYDSIADNLTSYTDFSDSIPDGELWYFIELRHPFGCTIEKAVNRNMSRSNSGSTGSASSESDDNNFGSYTFNEAIVNGTVISTGNSTVDVTVGTGTDVTGLVAIFTKHSGATVKIDGVTQVSGTTANNFTNPVIYTIIAENGSAQDWTVTVTVEGGGQSSENDFLTYSFPDSVGTASINTGNHTVISIVAVGTDLTNLVATFTSSTGSTVKIGDVEQISGTTTNDFTNSVTYTIIAEDGTSAQDWTVSVAIEGELNSGTDFFTYQFTESSEISDINTGDHSIRAEVNAGTDVTGLAAHFTLSVGAAAYISGVEQVSTVTVNDFLSYIIYNVVAEDGTEQLWIVNVTVTGIDDIAGGKQLKLYPNPNTGLFTLETDMPGISELTYFIYSVAGILMETNELQIQQAGKFDFNLSKYDSGIYYIKLISDKGTYNHKIMIK